MRVVGVVVAIDNFSGRRVFTIDDSSGACIEAATPYNEKAASAPLGLPGTTGPHADIDVGAVVDVKGALATFRDELQVRIERVTRVPSTGDEVALWEKRARFGREVLARPWVLAPGDVLRAREEAEQEDREADRRTRRLREAIAASSLGKGNKYAWRNKSGRA